MLRPRECVPEAQLTPTPRFLLEMEPEARFLV